MHPIGHDREGEAGDPTDREAGDVWMTKAELARVRRISVASADRLIRRQGWRKERGNDGRARVLVPMTWTQKRYADPTDKSDGPLADPTDVRRINPTDNVRIISVLEAEVAAVREDLARERDRADRAEQDRHHAEARADRAEQRTDRAEADREAERARADTLRDRVDAMQTTAETTEVRAAVLRDRLDAMQTQLAEAHASLQAATETERRAAQAETGREAERSRADGLRDRLDGLQAQLAAAERASDDLQAARTRAEERAGRAENDMFELKGQLAAAQTNAEQAARETQEARRAALAILQEEDAARRRFGILARFRAAWRGER
jgi:hypothetical protein